MPTPVDSAAKAAVHNSDTATDKASNREINRFFILPPQNRHEEVSSLRHLTELRITPLAAFK